MSKAGRLTSRESSLQVLSELPSAQSLQERRRQCQVSPLKYIDQFLDVGNFSVFALCFLDLVANQTFPCRQPYGRPYASPYECNSSPIGNFAGYFPPYRYLRGVDVGLH